MDLLTLRLLYHARLRRGQAKEEGVKQLEKKDASNRQTRRQLDVAKEGEASKE